MRHMRTELQALVQSQTRMEETQNTDGLATFSNRQQTIESKTGFADFASVRSGVPQGSILGLTLFLIFIK